MSRTFSCGELKKAKFILSNNVNIAGNEFENLSKSREEDKGDIYQIKPGARILKINSKEDLIKLIEKNSDGNLQYKQTTANDNEKSLAAIQNNEFEKILENIKETYDGISIDKKLLNKLSLEEKELLGGEEGVKILNKEVLTNISKGEENSSYREGFKANGTELSNEMKEISSEAYMNGGVISAKIAEFPMYNYSVNETYYNDKDISDDVNKFSEVTRELKPENLMLREGIFSDIKLEKRLIVSNADCYKTKLLCENALGKDISHKEYMECLSLYAKGTSKVDTESYNKAYSKLKQNVMKGIQINSDGTFDRPILYAEDRELITNVSKEALHMEKMAWDYALSKASDSQKELLTEMAKIKLNPYQQTHLDNKLNDIVTYSIGDMEVKFYSKKTTDMINNAVEPQIDNINRTNVRVSISNAFNSAKETFFSIKNSDKVNSATSFLASKRDTIVKVFNTATEDLRSGTNELIEDVKKLPKDLSKAYSSARREATRVYKNTTTNIRSEYNNTTTSIKEFITSNSSKAWKGVKKKVGLALINAGESIESTGNKIKTKGQNI